MNNDLFNTPILKRPTLRIGDKGEFVILLQELLKNMMFYDGASDGDFGNKTSLSVKAFQTNNKLTVDGIVGKDTWSALIYLYSPLNICETEYYTVKQGDILWGIAQRFNTTVSKLMHINNLSSNILTVGQRLITTNGLQIEKPKDEIFYTVKRGDTLWGIAQRFNTTVSELMRINNLKGNILSVGQQLTIKVDEEFQPEETTYIVQQGDTLWSIARMYNTTVDKLINLNNLKSTLLSIGQVLKII